MTGPVEKRISVCIRPIEIKDDEGHVWERVIVEYQSGSAYGCHLDMDEISHIFLLRDTIDKFIEDNNLKRPEK